MTKTFFMMLICLLTSIDANSVSLGAQSGHVDPKMRAVDRDWDYFKSIPCDRLAKITFHSRSEEILLAKRKSQCIDKYKAFLPKPLDR